MKYYISDLHLFHDNAIKYDNRSFSSLEEMHSTIKRNWNSIVTNGDTVYILGDIAMRGTSEELIAFVSTLKGRKVLIKGNHDDVRDQRYAQLFEEICEYKELSDSIKDERGLTKNVRLILSHYPILIWNRQHHGSVLLYGHVHNSIEDDYFKKCIEGMVGEDFENRRSGSELLRAYNVGCMMPYMNYQPRTLSEILNSTTIAEKMNLF